LSSTLLVSTSARAHTAPYQPCPGPTSFRVWQRLLATAFFKGHRRSVSAQTRDLHLRRPLGRWLLTSTAFRCHWTSFYSASSNERFLVLEADATYTCHQAPKIRRRPKHPVRAFAVAHSFEVTTLPADAVPVDCSDEPHKIVIPVSVPSLAPPAEPPPYIQQPGLSMWLLSSPENKNCSPLSPPSSIDGAYSWYIALLRSNDCIFLASDGGAADRPTSLLWRSAGDECDELGKH
jgi:hypothetical protein